jgi:hypothetical protein
MEVHAHTHTARKKWIHYFWEFIMLFLAVFAGFLAENLREHIVNREIEKNNIKSYVRNLQEDSLSLIQSIVVNEKRFNYLDSLISLKSSRVDDHYYQKQFIYYMLRLGYLAYFTSNESTFKQMQSSGTLRLIHHSDVLDSILSYQTHNEHIKQQEGICSVWWNKSIEQVSSVVDLTPLAHLAPAALWNLKPADLDNIPLSGISKESPPLLAYYNWRVNERISLGYYIQYLNKQLSNSRTLISLLKKTYHLSERSPLEK